MSFYLLATCMIVGDRTGHIDVIGPLLVRRIPATAIADVDSSQGLRITLHSGRTIRSVAHGQSLLGDWAKYPRSARAAARIAEFRSRFPDPAAEDEASVVTHLRVAGLTVALALGALLLAGTFVINHL
ncbi:hypothetical protein [Modestobacter roseus]|nr:hypothetical protein [Modestobacter roseus]MQA35736.1 hypothetical protein [Modestobacter roseus]